MFFLNYFSSLKIFSLFPVEVLMSIAQSHTSCAVILSLPVSKIIFKKTIIEFLLILVVSPFSDILMTHCLLV